MQVPPRPTDDQRDDNDDRERQHRCARGERGRNAVREQFRGVARSGGRGGEHDDEDTESERAAELMRNVDESRAGSGVFGAHASDTRDGERAENRALTDANQDHRQGHAGEVRAIGGEAAEPRHTEERQREPSGEQACIAKAPRQPRDHHRRREVRDCRRQDCKAGREGAVAQHALKELGGEEPEPHHGAEVEHARRVGADALAVCKEA